jgi:hypothetical protein
MCVRVFAADGSQATGFILPDIAALKNASKIITEYEG